MKRGYRQRLGGLGTCLALCMGLHAAEAPCRVGLFRNDRSTELAGVSETLTAAGMAVTLFTGQDLQKPESLKDCDVLYFCGGFDDGYWLGANGARVVLDFAAHGKGVLTSGFRSGAVRTVSRPLFPDIAQSRNKQNSNYVLAKGDHPILRGFSGTLCNVSWDHVVMKTGPQGVVFLTDVDGEAVGVCGEILNGRYVALGIFIGLTKEPLRGDEQTLFLNCIRWLSGGKRLEGQALADSRTAAELSYWRQKLILDYTRDEKGPDYGAGIIPAARYDLQTPLDALRFRLQYQEQWLAGAELQQAANARTILEKALARLESNCQDLMRQRVDEIKRLPLEALRQDTADVFRTNLPERLLPQVERETVRKEAETVLAALRPKTQAAKTMKDREAREADLATVPGLLEECQSGDVEIRRRASRELGRIGDRRAAPALISRIADTDEVVRRNAVLGLGWMQAPEAVTPLIQAAQSSDQWMRRRAVQSLGQIGDPRAVPVLLPMIRHPDPYTAENAILALGWLQDSQAVQPLLDLITELNPKTVEGHDRASAAIRALGHIGDERAVPALEQFAKTANDDPASRGRPLICPYLTEQRTGLAGYSKLALEEIKQKGRKPGVVQPAYLALSRYFYGVRDRFNFWGGRPALMWRWPRFQNDPYALLDILWSGGATGYLTGWDQPPFAPPEMLALLQAIDDRDQRIITDLPKKVPFFGDNVPLSGSGTLVHKAGCERDIFFCSDSPAFGGFWTEESYPDVAMNDAQFEAFLNGKYGADFRAKLGLVPNAKITVPAYGKRQEQRRLWVEYLDAAGQAIIEDWREAQEWMHSLRKACAFTFSLSAPYYMSKYLGVYPKAGGVIDVHGPESYCSHGSDNVFQMELSRDGESRPVMCEFYNWYCPSPAHAERGFAAHLVHGESFYNFYIAHLFAQAPTDDMWVWDKPRWAAAQRTFLKARRVREYLSPTRSVANVALVYSDRTSLLFSSAPHNGREYRYYQHQSALWDAFRQSHIPLDTIWAETLTAEKAARYRALILSDAKSLDPRETELIRQWVKNGGVLLASGTTSLFNLWGEQEKNYQLADLFGVSYRGPVAETDPAKVDTYGFADSVATHVQLVNENMDPQKILRYVHREIKPSKSIRAFRLEASSFAIPGVETGMSCEVDMAFGYDQVSADKATVLARWPNGDPAVTENAVGNGRVLFLTAVYPGLSHCSSGWEQHPLYKRFWPGMRELLAGLLLRGLKETGTALPARVEGLPDQVELTVRSQPESERWVVHLLNYDPKLERVPGGQLIVRSPDGRTVKRVLCPDTNTELPFRPGEGAVTVELRDFAVHDMVVIEWNGP